LKIVRPCCTAVTRRVVKDRPSRTRSTWYTIGTPGRPGRRKYACSECTGRSPSVVRAAACGAVRPEYAGYTAWRGAFPVDRLTAPGRWPEDECAYVVFPGGHLIVYRIPDGSGRGQNANWVLYTTPPPGHDPAPDSPVSLPPGTAPAPLREHLAYVAEELLPPYWGDLVRLTTREELILQPLYDFTAERYTAPGMALTGDAATVARPHTGAGAVKALQDATALEAALSGAPTLSAALAAYDADRASVGRTMVTLGRRLGRELVERTPPWRSMDGAGLETWWRGLDGSGAFGGRRLEAAGDRPAAGPLKYGGTQSG